MAKAIAPVDTGNLKNSINTNLSNLESLEGEVFAGAEYAVYVEFGTIHQPAQPFMTPAFDATKIGFDKVVAAILRRRVR